MVGSFALVIRRAARPRTYYHALRTYHVFQGGISAYKVRATASPTPVIPRSHLQYLRRLVSYAKINGRLRIQLRFLLGFLIIIIPFLFFTIPLGMSVILNVHFYLFLFILISFFPFF